MTTTPPDPAAVELERGDGTDGRRDDVGPAGGRGEDADEHTEHEETRGRRDDRHRAVTDQLRDVDAVAPSSDQGTDDPHGEHPRPHTWRPAVLPLASRRDSPRAAVRENRDPHISPNRRTGDEGHNERRRGE